MPRSIPGSYGVAIFDHFIENIVTINTRGKRTAMIKDDNDAPRWYSADTLNPIIRIEYEVNINKMERKLAVSDASIIRPHFAGFLNYSVFGWIDGLEKEAVQCQVQTCTNWPIFSSNKPSATLSRGSFSFNTENYFSLADGQLFLGDAFRVKEFKGIVPLFVASYCQSGDEWLDDYGQQGISSMGILKDYFGELPFTQYSIVLCKAIPIEASTASSLAMEHLQSASFFGDTLGRRTTAMGKDQLIRTMPTYLHHMSHAFIPLHCYGDAYRPYPQEIPSIINNIWFNEGFMWFLAYDTLKLERMKNGFNNNVYKTSPAIKKLTLQQLSQAASTMYGTDFRLGRSIYSRGALMAMEINAYLKEQTAGSKSMKDVFRYLYQWSKQNQRAFTMEEFPLLLNKACGINLDKIYARWQLPVE